MATLYTASGLSGSGSASFPGGPHVVTDIEALVMTVGPDVHLFPLGPDFRLQHVGWYGVGFLAPRPGPPVGNPQIIIAWWKYIDFVAEDPGVDLDPAVFQPDSFIWRLEFGCTLDVTVSG